MVAKDLVKDAEEKGYANFIEYLLDNPLQIPDFRPLTREEIYHRSEERDMEIAATGVD